MARDVDDIADDYKTPGTTASSPSAGEITPSFEGDFILPGALPLDSGLSLFRPTLHYTVYGEINPAHDNVVLACHALSGSARVGEWWPELFTTSAPDSRAPSDATSQTGIVDLARDCVICVNLLGSCYGSTGPSSINPGSSLPYGPEFPLVSIRDNVRAQAQLLDSLGIDRLKLAIGGSIGGMQALDWAILYPERIARAVIIAVAPLSAMGIALNHLQRLAIQSDPAWNAGNYPSGQPPLKGLTLAREIATISYKSPELFAQRFARKPNRRTPESDAPARQAPAFPKDRRVGEDPWSAAGLIGGRFDIAGYLDHQGERFPDRFDANAYLAILRTMETWDPARGYPSPTEAFARIQADLVFIGIASDWLFPAAEVKALAAAVGHAIRSSNPRRSSRVEYKEMGTDHGHDAFLAEQSELVRLINPQD